MEERYDKKIEREAVIQKLKENGCRITKQRRILLDVILAQDCISCKEMYYKANRIDPSIGIATVYRMINTLEEIGVFNRKNLYKIACGTECKKENACTITFEDHSDCQLSGKEWHHVISEGLRVCGYSTGKKVICVEEELCTGHCG